ncbi:MULTISPECIES: Holliday junction branch migration protein RuvA [unclassified Sphingopyxis]|uniref:Holliday junction branch migration protein RuvA n=1 Tax=unclassified Sphingopyxis TaxID=2614943 RepID=UPI00072FFE27|nr:MULTISPECIES: Holliday junction branch migration protein RuvA [unclassified Sphingopyxis]KTE22285.1 Holliday junction ATP-dependent DNA helicase RuvA [Sphingopyxis sp. H057]KTE49937.1 Holliday junction ATP-dependent DNA helicase RuvA [Sphingopyxis sp. H071]KTE51167.1 Holliday junction ATP-dependent DNA helicase RuvA [Sphingopyxis sp. H073]KTE59020.1 Holliday junction ATP-dependent DNA helicase RuvA [Sphingopyxis sp. H107]KTE60619.1 Holliday junction ATP-dependent DNA helicase RuvA [Sphingop
MIAKLTGRLDSSGAGHAVIDVGGVGYLVEASARTLDALGPVGGDVTIHTEMLVGEDFLRLLGFAKAAERDWFRLLTSVQGVGAKVALAILSALEIGDLQRALASGDSAMIARANGVGPKLAQRITHELKDKAGALGGIAGSSPARGTTSGPLGDAVTALTGLGFKPGEASAAVAAASEELGADASLDALVRVALKKAAK